MSDLDRDDAAENTAAEAQPRAGEDRSPEGQRPIEGGGENEPRADDASTEQRMVPHQALHAAREEAKAYRERHAALESRFNEMQQQQLHLLQQMASRQQPQPEPQPPPDWFADPDQAFQHNFHQYMGQVVTPLQQAIVQQREQFSQMMAVEKFGADTVQAAERELAQWAQQNPQAARHDWQRIMASGHPYGELVAWHKQRSTLNRFGDDPDGVIEQEVQRRLAEMGHALPPQNTPAQSQPRNPNAMPSSFAGARGGGPRGAAQASGPRSLSEIMGR